MPTRRQVERAVSCIEALRERYHGIIVIDAVLPDYFARYPKPCMGIFRDRPFCGQFKFLHVWMFIPAKSF